MDYSEFYDQVINFYGKIASKLPFGYALPPIRTTIEITYCCNLQCSMCYQIRERKDKKLRLELKASEIKKVIDQMPPKTLISLTGGEILTKNYVLDLVNYACRSHNCNLVTNGTLIDEDMAQKLVKTKVFLIGISLDGLGNVHNKIRGVKGAFEKAVAGIKLIQKEKAKLKKRKPLIDIKTVILPENVSQLYKLYWLCRQLKVNFLTISVLKGSAIQLSPPVLETISENDFHSFFKTKGLVNPQILQRQLEMIFQDKSEVKVRFYPGNLGQRVKEYYTDKIKISDYFPCIFPWTAFNISPYGDIFPCIALNVGNIREKSLWQIWNGQKMRQFRQKLKKHQVFPACQGCCNLWLKESTNRRNCLAKRREKDVRS